MACRIMKGEKSRFESKTTAVGSEVPEDGDERISGLSDAAKPNSPAAPSGGHESLESNQFVDHGHLKLGHRLNEPFALLRCGGQLFSYPETAPMGRARSTRR
jgi:hypothetical protein